MKKLKLPFQSEAYTPHLRKMSSLHKYNKVQLIHRRTFYKAERELAFEYASLTSFMLLDFFFIKTIFQSSCKFTANLRESTEKHFIINTPHQRSTFLKIMKTRCLLSAVEYPPDKNGQRAPGSVFNLFTNFLRVQQFHVYVLRLRLAQPLFALALYYQGNRPDDVAKIHFGHFLGFTRSCESCILFISILC